jgi:SNF2 family DNA or RNA helicase
MLGSKCLEKECPSVEKLLEFGVPSKIANVLAPFQRKGVGFVHERNGKALIADEMGLGKTIQSIASIAMYYNEWPVLVLTPSGARYHWQHEFLDWLGDENHDGKVLAFDYDNQHLDAENSKGCSVNNVMQPLLEKQVHVLESGNTPLIPSADTKIVIVSYGLAPKLVEENKLNPGDFKCAIVDESHMLKNKKSKRTKTLMPVLAATTRCILLSGTPAFARPIELWPQISILGSAEDPSLLNESAFVAKYVEGRRKNRLADLHAVLTSTIMIRRMKNDILRQLPPKVRELALVNVLDESTRQEFEAYLEIIQQSKGAFGNIAKQLQNGDQETLENKRPLAELSSVFDQMSAQVQDEEKVHERKLKCIFETHDTNTNPTLQGSIKQPLNYLQESNVSNYQQYKEIKEESSQHLKNSDNEVSLSKKSALLKIYQRTGQVKIPLLAKMLTLWLQNPANGKLCIFAHHISVLNEISSIVGLSNDFDNDKKFIRIDGSTSPKHRQEQIAAFQTDPTIRVAMLGITAAGVAVTLTASSTVWFAELFWTPALLIQAEDRCHRIGQLATCRCLYIVAKGTLDELLWKHIENKFRDLGEFVEGKEKLKLLVHKVIVGSSSLIQSIDTEALFCDDNQVEDGGDIDCNSEHGSSDSFLYKELKNLELDDRELVNGNL